MSTKDLKFSLEICGLDIENVEDAIPFLEGWIKESVKAGLLGNNKHLFNFRDAYDSDIEITLIKHSMFELDG